MTLARGLFLANAFVLPLLYAVPAQASGKSNCQWSSMPDGSRVEMCKGANGKWAPRDQQDEPEPAGQSTGSSGLPRRAEVTYKGSWSASVSTPPKINLNKLDFRTLLNQATHSSKTLGGEFNIIVQTTGNSLVATVWGRNFTRAQYGGSIQNGICRLKGGNNGAQENFEGQCSTDGFSGTIKGKTVQGQNFQATFDTAAVQLVDIEQREREQLAAKKASEAAAVAEAARIRNAPAAGPALTKKLDGFVQTDSRGWAFNSYDAGSLTNVKILDGSVKSGHYTLRGEYRYNGGNSGWVLAKMSGANLDCIQFHDAMIGCRPLRTPEQGSVTRAAAMGAMSGGSGGSSSQDYKAERAMRERNDDYRAQEEAQAQRNANDAAARASAAQPSPLGW
jgi:hypothetical protein